MSRRRERFPVPSKNYGGSYIFDFVPQPGDPPPGRPPLALAPGDDERTRADKTTRITGIVVGLITELIPDLHQPTVEDAAREFVERLARASQPEATCHASTSKNSTATPSVEGASP